MKTLNLNSLGIFVETILNTLSKELNISVYGFHKELKEIYNKLNNKETLNEVLVYNVYGQDVKLNFWSYDGSFLNVKIIDDSICSVKHIDFKIVSEEVTKSTFMEKINNKYKGLKFKSFIKDCKNAKNPEELFNRIMEFVGEDTSSSTTFKRGEFTVYSNISINKINESVDLNLSIKDDEDEFSMKFDFHSSKEGLLKLYNKVEDILSKFE